MVDAEAVEMGRHRPLVAGRAQAHVDIVEHALGGQAVMAAIRRWVRRAIILVEAERTGAIRPLGTGRMIIDEDEIEIGRRRHLAAAKLAQRQHGACARATRPWRSAMSFSTADSSRCDQDLGQCRRRRRRPRRRSPFPTGRGRRRGTACSLPITRARSITSSRACLAGDAPRPPGTRSPPWRGKGPKKPAVEHGVEHLGATATAARRGAAPSRGSWRSDREARIGLEQREQLHARRQAGEKPVEGDEGVIGIAGSRASADSKRRHQLGQKLAGARAAGRGIAAEMPAAHRRRQLRSAGGSPSPPRS